MSGFRRFSQALSEGDGISVIVEVDGPEAAAHAEESGAEAVLVYSGHENRLGAIREATALPVLFYFDGEKAGVLAGADACVVDIGETGRGDWLDQVRTELEGFELAVRIRDEDELEFVRDEVDPEIFVLAAPGSVGEEALERILDLLPDIPAGKLAIAEVAVTSREQVVALERAGMDGVIVPAGEVAELVGGAPPEV